MFWLQFIPDKIMQLIVHGAIVLGIIGLIVSFLSNVIIVVRPYKNAISLVSILLLTSGSYFEGKFDKEKEYQQRVAELQKRLDEITEHSKHENERIEKEVVDRLSKLKGKVNETKKDIEKHKKVIDSECVLPDVARMLYNRSIKNEVPRSSTNPNGTSTKPRGTSK